MESPKKHFEYLVLEVGQEAPKSDQWNKLGMEGWELVTVQALQWVVTSMSPMETTVIKSHLIFKREAQEAP